VLQDKEFAEDVVPKRFFPADADTKRIMALGEGFASFNPENQDAAQTWVRFVMEEGFWRQFMMITPGHIQSGFPKMRNDEQLRNQLYEVDGWTKEQIDYAQINGQIDPEYEGKSLFGETSPPNPYASALWGNSIFSRMMVPVMKQERDIETVVKETAEFGRQVIADQQ
jgi:hypothetical protein